MDGSRQVTFVLGDAVIIESVNYYLQLSTEITRGNYITGDILLEILNEDIHSSHLIYKLHIWMRGMRFSNAYNHGYGALAPATDPNMHAVIVSL